MPSQYKKELIKLIEYEREFEETEMRKKLIELLLKHESNGEKTIRNISGHPMKKYPISVKFKSENKLITEINELDTVLVSDENHPEKILEGMVLEKRSHSILIVFNSDKILEWGIPNKARIDLFVRDSEYRKMIQNLEMPNDNVFMALQFALNHLNPENKKIKYIKFHDKTLNKSQKNAIIRSLKSKDFFLIHGAFGTGKTKTLIELIRQEVKQDSNVLVTADSNAAVDNIVERLIPTNLNVTRIGNESKINNNVKKATLTFKLKNHPKYKEISKNFDKINELKRLDETEYEINQLYAKNNELKQEIESEIISKSQVILTTNSSAALEIIQEIQFDVAIIDEASQTTIPKVLIPISKADKFILAGDHKQLPPTVKSNCKQLEETLFEKLINNFPTQKQFLNIQHRMNETLMKFPNKKFYNNKLKCGKKVKTISINCKFSDYDTESPLIFLDTKSLENNSEKKYENSTSRYNPLESKLASDIANQYLKLKIPKNKIGIISHYDDQVNLIKNKTSVEVNTVDGFQGNEKEIIIISNVRSNLDNKTGFLSDDKRLNVALTRAKRKLVVIGDSETLKYGQTYCEFIKHCKNENCIVELTENMLNMKNKNYKPCELK